MRFTLLVTTLIQKQLITQNKKISVSLKQTAVCVEDAFPACPFCPPRACPSSAGGSQRGAGRLSRSFRKQRVLLGAIGRQWKWGVPVTKAAQQSSFKDLFHLPNFNVGAWLSVCLGKGECLLTSAGSLQLLLRIKCREIEVFLST